MMKLLCILDRMAYIPLTVFKCVFIALKYTFTEFIRQLFSKQKIVKGDIILITGGGRGLGRKLALAFAENKPKHIILWGRNIESLQGTQAEIVRLGVPASYYQCDVSSRLDVYQKAAAVKENVGDVTMLINNAGVVHGKRLLDLEPAEMEYDLQVNTLAHIWTIKSFLPAMIESGHGHIVAISSILGLLGLKGTGSYSTSKFALTGLMDSVRLEVEEYPGIHTTVVHPYQIDNSMFAGMAVRFPKLFPPLNEDGVARDIVSGVLYNRKQLIMPMYFHLVLFFRSILPVSSMLPTQKFFGLDNVMENFHGTAT